MAQHPPNGRRDDVTYTTGDEIPPCGLSRARVFDFAGRVRQKLNPDGIPLHEQIARLGGRLHIESSLPQGAGSIMVHGPRDFDIYVEDSFSEGRNRFTMAHELGHYFLHSNQGARPLVARRLGTGRLEWEANWFAAEFLMPAEAFVRAWQELSPAQVALTFKVSLSAVSTRAEFLQLL